MAVARFNQQQLLLLEKVLEKLDHVSEILDTMEQRMEQNSKRMKESLMQWDDQEDEEEEAAETVEDDVEDAAKDEEETKDTTIPENLWEIAQHFNEISNGNTLVAVENEMEIKVIDAVEGVPAIGVELVPELVVALVGEEGSVEMEEKLVVSTIVVLEEISNRSPISLVLQNLDPILNSILSYDPLQLPFPSIPLRNNPLLPSFSSVIPNHPIIEEGPTIRMNIGKRKIPPKPPPTKGNVALRFNGRIQEQINKDHPNSNPVFVVGKATGAKWKSLSEVKTAPCVAMDDKRKANYEKWIRDDHHGTEESKMVTSAIQRFFIVAIIGVAVAESKENQIIWQLTKYVELRDQVLSSMQQKLNIFREEVNNIRDPSGDLGEMAATINVEFPCNKAFGSDSIKFVDCGCWLCDQHCDIYNTWSGCMKSSSGDGMPKYKLAFSNEAEPKGRVPKLFEEMLDRSVWVALEIKARSDGYGRFMYFLPGRIYSSKHGGLRTWYNPVLGVKEELDNYSDEDYLVRPTAIFLAWKYEKIFVPLVGDLVLILDKAYTMEEVIDMEKLMGKKLFVSQLLDVLPLKIVFSPFDRGRGGNHAGSWNVIVLMEEQGPQCKAKGVAIGLPQLIILVIFSQYIPHLMRGETHVFDHFVVIFLVMIVWIYAHLLTVGGAYKNTGPKTQISCRTIHSRSIGDAPWVRVSYPFPWGATTFDAGKAFALMAASFVTLVEPIGAFFAVSRFQGREEGMLRIWFI